MANANLNISVVEKRLLSQTEAAAYTGLPVKHFIATCPVRPLEVRTGKKSWDRRDLDHWIDAMKEGREVLTQADILRKLE